MGVSAYEQKQNQGSLVEQQNILGNTRSYDFQMETQVIM